MMAEPITLRDRHFCLGLAIYGVGLVVERVAPLKLTEFFLLWFLLNGNHPLFPMQARRFVLGMSGLLAVFTGWALLCEFIAQANMIKTLFRLVLLFLPVILFVELLDQRRLLALIIGMFAGYWLNFLAVIALRFMGIDLGYAVPGDFIGAATLQLKWVVPAPMVPLVILVSLWSLLSRGQKRLWGLAILSSAVGAFYLESRTALTMLAVSAVFLVAARLVRAVARPAVAGVLGLAFCLLPVGPLIMAHRVDPLDMKGTEYDTPSNNERLFMLRTSLDIIAESPVVGIGSEDFHDRYAPDYERLFNDVAGVDSPHNFLMEVGVAWGVPAILAVMLLHFILAHRSLKWGATADRLLALGAISVIYAVLPVADSMRLATTVLWFCALRRRDASGTGGAAPVDCCAARQL